MILSYTDRKNKLKPIRLKSSGKPTKPRVKKLETLINYDAFDLDKAVISTKPLPTPKRIIKRVSKVLGTNEPIYIGQNVYIRPSYIVSLPEYLSAPRAASQRFIDNQKNLADNSHAGLLSRKSISKMKNAVNWLLCSAKDKMVFSRKRQSWFKFKINFVTLTLPDTSNEVSDENFKEKLVQPFLAYMRKFHSLGNYVWKLEFQRNGKLHLHLATETFIHHEKIRKCWNTILGHNGLLLDFYNKFGHADPNSTDVHSVKKVRNLAGYLAKYMSKQSEDLVKIKGRIWGCSEGLSRANTTRVFIDRNACHQMMRPLMQKSIEYKAIMQKSDKTQMNKKIGELFFLNFNNWKVDIQGTIKETFLDTISFLQNTSGNELLRYEV